MAQQSKQDDILAIHQYYMDIINCMPHIVYWIDTDCLLKGCNHNFIALLGLKRMKDFVGTPYDQMTKHLKWPSVRIESLKLDDMAALFSSEPKYEVDESPIFNEDGTAIYYRSRRVPLFDKEKHVVGLVVVLEDMTDQKTMQNQFNLSLSPQEPNETRLPTNTRLRVLVVEDNIIAQHVEQALFQELNCDVDVADSGVVATELFVPGKYNIVFMDIGLQDTSGYVVSKKLREMEKNTEYHVPIIALTSYQADVVKYDCNDYFMDGVITKPLSNKQAEQIIKRYVYHENIEISGLQSVK